MLAILRKTADGLISLSAFAGTLGLLFVTGVVLVDVIGRAFGAPLRGGQDFYQMGMVIIVFVTYQIKLKRTIYLDSSLGALAYIFDRCWYPFSRHVGHLLAYL